MTIPSVLFSAKNKSIVQEKTEPPEFFENLNIDQVIEAITKPKQDYKLKPFFYTPLNKIDAINYRQDIFRDLEIENVVLAIKEFAEKMVLVRRYLKMIEKLYFKKNKLGWFLEAAIVYCDAVKCLFDDIAGEEISSAGLIDFLTYLNNYISSPSFQTLHADSHNQKTALDTIQYCVNMKGNWVRVQKYDSEIDYSKEVEQTFNKFHQEEAGNYKINLIVSSGMNHIEAQILDCVANLYPDVFESLEVYAQTHFGFMDNVVLTFDRQIQFFISYLDFIEYLKIQGLEFCYPTITKEKHIKAQETFDIALASKLRYISQSIVCNDFYLEGKERILVVSGPNQGGKTTFARMFGQLHFLASLGCPVPGKEATLFLFDQIFTHFEKEENIKNLQGKLKDDVVRIHKILNGSTSNSIIIINEIFTSTSYKDAVILSKEIIERVIDLDALSVCVTFIDELSSISEQTVSMVSTVLPENPTERTFKIQRMPADGLAYAICIAKKYNLTFDLIKERIAQ